MQRNPQSFVAVQPCAPRAGACTSLDATTRTVFNCYFKIQHVGTIHHTPHMEYTRRRADKAMSKAKAKATVVFLGVHDTCSRTIHADFRVRYCRLNDGLT